MQKVKKFKIWLKEQRLDRGMTQQELAKELKVTSFTIHNLEAGITIPRIKSIKAICEFFNVSPKLIREMIEVQ